MLNEIQTQVYAMLREAAGLSQIELAVAAAMSRSRLQRIETGQRLPTPEEEENILMATDSNNVTMAELICRVLSKLIGRRVQIVDDEVGYQAATPEGELDELLRAAHGKMRRDRWWAWKERVGQHKALGQLYEAQGFSLVRDLTAEVEDLFQDEKPAALEAAAGDNEGGGDMLPFRRP